MAKPPNVIRPSFGWFVLLDGGLLTLTVLSISEPAHRLASENGPLPLPPQSALRRLLFAATLTHVGEAVLAARMARRRGLRAGGWARQTFVVGFPSLLQLRKLPGR